MPGRRRKIYTNGVYHVFNKTINSYPIFKTVSNADLFLKTIEYYRSVKACISLSRLHELSAAELDELMKTVNIEKFFRVKVLAYCLMPTHYHLLLEQTKENGVSKFIGDSINSFTRHLNIKNQRKGPYFLTKFKAVQVVTNEQLIHVSRYIHLNPFSSEILTQIDNLKNYPWSSCINYLGKQIRIVDTNPILKIFDNNQQKYQEFVEGNAEYQKTLEVNKKAISWI